MTRSILSVSRTFGDLSKTASSPNYVIITPARDEEELIGQIIGSVCAQTLLPIKWIIVDDGSTDCTSLVAKESIGDRAWIELVKLSSEQVRAPGAKVVEAFKFGESFLQVEYEFIVKLDADVSLPPDYFERLLGEFNQDPDLGIAGGYCAVKHGSELILEATPVYHVRGATKVYRRECYLDIGGLVSAMGWDTLDEMKAMMLGWKTKSFREITLMHPRPTGTASGSVRYAWAWGKSMWFMGHDPFFAVLSSVKRVIKKPYGIFGLVMLFSYIMAGIRKEQVIEDKQLVRFTRKFQRRKMLGRHPEELVRSVGVNRKGS